MVDSNDKFLPNFIIFICSILAITAIVTIFSFATFNSIFDKNNTNYTIDEINIFQIPIETLVTTELLGENFDGKNSIYVVIKKLSEENSIDEKVIKNILLDDRLNRFAFKQLYTSISNSLHNDDYFINNSSANEMVQKIIGEYELKYQVTIPNQMKNQLATIMTSYIREISSLSLIDNKDSKINTFFSIYTVLISILVLIASWLVISIINKNKILTLKRCGMFGLIIGLIALIYSVIQKMIFWVLQTYFDQYSYVISSVGNILFVAIFTCSFALILISLLMLLFANDILSFDKSIRLFRKKKKVIKKKKKSNKLKNAFKKLKKIKKKKKKANHKRKKYAKNTKKSFSIKEIIIEIKSFIINLLNKVKTKKTRKKGKDLSNEA